MVFERPCPSRPILQPPGVSPEPSLCARCTVAWSWSPPCPAGSLLGEDARRGRLSPGPGDMDAATRSPPSILHGRPPKNRPLCFPEASPAPGGTLWNCLHPKAQQEAMKSQSRPASSAAKPWAQGCSRSTDNAQGPVRWASLNS